jgi:hypothetical protein
MSRFTQRHLDPASRAGEILFGLIMVLAATLTAGLKVSEGKAGVRQLLLPFTGSARVRAKQRLWSQFRVLIWP